MPILLSDLLSPTGHPRSLLFAVPERLSAFFRGDGDGKLELTDQVVMVPLRIVTLVVGFFVLRWILHKLIRRLARRPGNGAVIGVLSRSKRGQEFVENTLANERKAQRAETIASLLCSAVTIVLSAVLVVMVLAELGFNILPVVASASIIGVALGFGAQTLVKDFLAGVFMIFEDQYGVGDLIDMEKATGVVEAVGLRITRLRGEDGTIWYVRNGEVFRVGNLTNRDPGAGSTGVGSAAEKAEEQQVVELPDDTPAPPAQHSPSGPPPPPTPAPGAMGLLPPPSAG